MPFILGLLKPYALKLLAGLVIAGVVAAVLLGARNAGRMAERVEGIRRQLANVKERTDVENRVATADAAERGRLRRKWQRD